MMIQSATLDLLYSVGTYGEDHFLALEIHEYA